MPRLLRGLKNNKKKFKSLKMNEKNVINFK